MVHPVTAAAVTPEPHTEQAATKHIAPQPSATPAYSVKLSSKAADVDHDGDSR